MIVAATAEAEFRATAAGRPALGAPAPIYIVCSTSRGVGKTLLARLLHDHYLAEGRPVAAFDLADDNPRLTDFVAGTASIVDIATMRGQMALFDGLIATDAVTKIVDVSPRMFEEFFTIAHKIDLFAEARRRSIEPMILFMIDPNPKAERAYASLRRWCPGVSLLPVRNQMVAKGVPRAAFRHASRHAVSIEIPSLGQSHRPRIERAGFSFVEACRQPAEDAAQRRDDEVSKWVRRIRCQFREIELCLIGERILTALQ
jgi:hypothetical protein